MRPRRRIKGDRSFRKLLRRLPDSMREEMVTLLDQTGDSLLAIMRADAPSRTGALRAGITKKLLKGSLKLRVGLIGKPINRRLYYGRIVEFGRKAKTVQVRRRTKAGGVSSYSMRVRAMPARAFVYSRRTALRQSINRTIRSYWENVLGRAASGVTDD